MPHQQYFCAATPTASVASSWQCSESEAPHLQHILTKNIDTDVAESLI